jgi:hypothetical protein
LSWHGLLRIMAAVIHILVRDSSASAPLLLRLSSEPVLDFRPLSLSLRIKVVFNVLASVG